MANVYGQMSGSRGGSVSRTGAEQVGASINTWKRRVEVILNKDDLVSVAVSEYGSGKTLGEFNGTADELVEVFQQARLEYLRGEIRAERISYAEIAELQSLVGHIDEGDVELLEWAGVPEHPAEVEDPALLERFAERVENDETPEAQG